MEDERVVAGRSEPEVDPSPFINAARIDAEHATVNGVPVGKVIEGGNSGERSWRSLVHPRDSDRRPHSVHHTHGPATSACPCSRFGGVVAQPHEAGPTRKRRLDLSERRRARREQLIEEPIESRADKTDQTVLEHRSAAQHRGYSLGEPTQVVEKRIDRATLEKNRLSGTSTIERVDMETASSTFGFDASKAWATFGKPTPKTVCTEAVG